jgi:hypothetical protein
LFRCKRWGHLAPPYIASSYQMHQQASRTFRHWNRSSRQNYKRMPSQKRNAKPMDSQSMTEATHYSERFANRSTDRPNLLDKEQPLKRRACRSTTHTVGQQTAGKKNADGRSESNAVTTASAHVCCNPRTHHAGTPITRYTEQSLYIYTL